MKMLDLSKVKENENSPVPAGTYSVVVTKAEYTTTKKGGQLLKVMLLINDGQPQAGRFLFDQFNVECESDEAREIGLSQLKRFMINFGHPTPDSLEDPSELVGLRGRVNTKIREDEGYEPQARISSYRTEAQAVAN
jgi:hypothetical protein